MAKKTSYIIKATCKLDEVEAVTFYVAESLVGGDCLTVIVNCARKFVTRGEAYTIAVSWQAAMDCKYADQNAYTFEVEAV